MAPKYILFDDSMENCKIFHYTLNYLNYKNIDINPVNIVQTNFPEIVTKAPSIYIPQYNEYIVGIDKCMIFLSYHSRLNINYVQLHDISTRYNDSLLESNTEKKFKTSVINFKRPEVNKTL